MDDEEVQQLLKDITAFMAASRSPRTMRTYARQAERWEARSRQHKVISYPTDLFLVILYVIHCTNGASSQYHW